MKEPEQLKDTLLNAGQHKQKKVYKKPSRPNAAKRQALRAAGKWPTAFMKARRRAVAENNKMQAERSQSLRELRDEKEAGPAK